MPDLSERIVTGPWHGADASFRRDRLIVSVKKEAPVRATLESVRASIASQVEGAKVIRRSGRPWGVLQFQPLADAAIHIPRIIEQLEQRSDLHYAEPDFIGTGHFVPNDEKYPVQWAAKKVEIEELWNLTRGSSRVLLAIVDSGICISSPKLDHPDLQGSRFILRHRRWFQTVSHNYVSDSISLPVNPSNFPSDLPRDEHGHGTHIAGIAAATGDNFIGIAGANWESPVYIARVIDRQNNLSASDVKLAVDDILDYAAGSLPEWLRPIRISSPPRVVINMSFGIQEYAKSLREVCQETADGNVIICAAPWSHKGSDSLDYPAAFAANFNHVIAVGCTDINDIIKEPKGGLGAITIFAPGMDIFSTMPPYPCTMQPTIPPLAALHKHGTYGTDSGTSQACALVSGAVSLLWSANHSLQPAGIRQSLLDTSVPILHDGVEYPRLQLGLHPHLEVERMRPVRNRILSEWAARLRAARLRWR